MEQAIVTARLRNVTGKGPSRRLRRENLIPGVIYSPDSRPLHLALDPVELRKALDTPKHLNTVITLDIDSDKQMVMLKDYQHDPVKQSLLHVDFVKVSKDRPVTVEVPVRLSGKSLGVIEGGILQQTRRELTVRCLPDSIPTEIEIDITPLEVGDSIHVSEVQMTEGVQAVFDNNFTICVVVAPEAEEEAPAAVEGAEAAEAAEGEEKKEEEGKSEQES